MTQSSAPAASLFPMANLAEQPLLQWMTGPDLEEQRATVKREMEQAFHAQLKPAGFTRKGAHWHKSSVHGESEFYFQKGKFGFECYLNAAVRPAKGPVTMASSGTIGSSTAYVRLSQFCPEMPNETLPDGLPYKRLFADAAFRDAVMCVFTKRMLPWITMLHEPQDAPAEMPVKPDWMTRLYRMVSNTTPPPASLFQRYPSPKDMVSVPVFSDA